MEVLKACEKIVEEKEAMYNDVVTEKERESDRAWDAVKEWQRKCEDVSEKNSCFLNNYEVALT